MGTKILLQNDRVCFPGRKGIREYKKFKSLRTEKMGIGRMEE